VLALGDWLADLEVTRVVMEATSDYWRAPFYLLEDRFETWLVNAHDVKHLPGRPKTDRLDATWPPGWTWAVDKAHPISGVLPPLNPSLRYQRPGPVHLRRCAGGGTSNGVVQLRRRHLRRPSRMTRPVRIVVEGRQPGRLLRTGSGPGGHRLGVQHGPVDGAQGNTGVSVTRSMWANHQAGDVATMIAAASRTPAWMAEGFLSRRAAVRRESARPSEVSTAVRSAMTPSRRRTSAGYRPSGRVSRRGVVAARGELPEDAVGGPLPGGVVVRSQEDARFALADVRSEQVGLAAAPRSGPTSSRPSVARRHRWRAPASEADGVWRADSAIPAITESHRERV
jgi:hypothetical protein